MRRVFNSFVRRFAAVTVIVVLATSVSAAPREGRERGPREKTPSVVKIVKKIVRALGDGLTVPLPAPRP